MTEKFIKRVIREGVVVTRKYRYRVVEFYGPTRVVRSIERLLWADFSIDNELGSWEVVGHD